MRHTVATTKRQPRNTTKSCPIVFTESPLGFFLAAPSSLCDSPVAGSNQPQKPQPKQNSSKQTSSDLSTLPAHSCDVCRKLKTYCSRRFPVCDRCKRLSLPCTYSIKSDVSEFLRIFFQRINQEKTRTDLLETEWKRFQDEKSYLACQLSHSPADTSSQASVSTEDKPLEGENEEKIEILLRNNWRVTRTASGLSLHTNLRNHADLVRFVQQLQGKSYVPNEGRVFGLGSIIYGLQPDRREFRLAFVWKHGIYSPPEEKGALLPPSPISQLSMGNRYKRIVADLVRLIADGCTFFLRVMDRDWFIAEYTNNTIDPLVWWSVMAWTARHAYFQHSFSAECRQLIVEYSEFAYMNARCLLEENFDQSSLETVLASICLHYYTLYEDRRPDYLRLARQHASLLLWSEPLTPLRPETLRLLRATLTITLMEHTYATFVDPTFLDNLEFEDEWWPLLAKRVACPELKTYVCEDMQIIRALNGLIRRLRRKEEFFSKEAFVEDTQAFFNEGFREGMQMLAKNEAAGCRHSVSRLRVEWKLGCYAAWIKLQLPLVLDGLREGPQVSTWTEAQQKAHRICLRASRDLLEAVRIAVTSDEICILSELADSLGALYNMHAIFGDRESARRLFEMLQTIKPSEIPLLDGLRRKLALFIGL
ncbi:uncharacterized protein VTP21DRAFT_5979 [Calcarisporiella thermophila]|uniref:uncharacterized protein n=1 Tax=Calcarisporiella thermophila TaxID=911321 RepID=UPI003742EA32